MSDVLKDFAVKALNITDEQFAEIVYSDDKGTVKETAIQELLRLDAERVTKLKTASKDELTQMHDKGYKKAQAESISKFENSIKEQFGVSDSTSQGIDLVKEIIAKISKDTNLDEEKVKLHPKYVELEKRLGTEYVAKAEYEKVKGEFDGYKNAVEKEKVLNVVTSDALKEFESLNPVLSADPKRAYNQKVDFLNKMKSFEYEVQADGNHIIKIDGKRFENAQGHPIPFKEFIKQQTELYFDLNVQGAKASAGNNNSAGGSGSITVPTDKAEYMRMLVNEPDPQRKIAMKNAWEAKNNK